MTAFEMTARLAAETAIEWLRDDRTPGVAFMGVLGCLAAWVWADGLSQWRHSKTRGYRHGGKVL